jgi:hypothetical protein
MDSKARRKMTVTATDTPIDETLEKAIPPTSSEREYRPSLTFGLTGEAYRQNLYRLKKEILSGNLGTEHDLSEV